MKILALSDEECLALWDYYTPGKLDGYDLIISCGDLKASYLSFIVTMARVPVLYVHGNHDTGYERNPPEGCDCIEDQLIVYNGVRILGLGGCRRYRPGPHQYTEREMRKRIRKLRWKLWWHKGVDVVVTHAPPAGVGDDEDIAHRGFEAFLPLLEKYRPQVLLHGHVHMNYKMDKTRERQLGDTRVINVCERYTVEVEAPQ
ncbi:MAG: metallophosphoesterase [Oscillospiraceae bacterium]|nr:metallophosphoesterase [Oscillospiraceae bacterium]